MVVFIADLSYAGIFTLNGIPDEQQEPILLVECPRLLFPFARNILADITRDGGFPPVMLGPIDFVGLWQSRRAQAAGIATPVGQRLIKEAGRFLKKVAQKFCSFGPAALTQARAKEHFSRAG